MHDDRFYKLIIICFGSWGSIIAHTVLFTLILIFSSDLLFFTMFLSVEAIFIGILILMATNREQAIIDKRTTERRVKDRELVKQDVNITHNVMEEIQLLKRHQMNSTKALAEIKDLLQTTTTPKG